LIATTSRPDSARPCQQRRKLRPVVVRRIGRRGQRPGACARSRARNSKNKDVHPKKRSSNEDRRAENRHAFSHELSSETLGILRDVSELCNAMRARARDVPMRPKPLMATLILASVVVLTAAAWCVEGRRGSATGRCRRVETRGVPHGARRFRGTWDASRNNSSRCASQRAYLDSLAALETGGLAAELNLKTRGKRKEGAGSVTCVASSSCARHTRDAERWSTTTHRG
jgi:hypothetical protein